MARAGEWVTGLAGAVESVSGAAIDGLNAYNRGKTILKRGYDPATTDPEQIAMIERQRLQREYMRGTAATGTENEARAALAYASGVNIALLGGAALLALLLLRE